MPADELGPRVAAGRETQPAADGAWDASGWALLLVIAALLLARIPVLAVRAFDPDEFEHAHAAWSVFRGLLPYRDFFEHHTPWYYFTLAPLFRWFAVDQSFDAARRFLLCGRLVSLAMTAVSLGFVFLVGRLSSGRRAGLLAAVFVAAQPVLIRKTIEIRPDVPAFLFFAAALWFLLRALGKESASSGGRRGWFLAGGLCLGGAVMCTQKMLFVLPGVFLGLGLWTIDGGRRDWGARASRVAIVLAGVAAPAAVTWLAFALHGAGRQFIYDNFLLNARWRKRSDRHLVGVLRTSWPILLLAAVGIGAAVRRFKRAASRDHGPMVLLCTLAGLTAGLVVVPAAYDQYYLPPLAIACLFAAQGLLFLLDLASARSRGLWLALAVLALMIWPAAELARASTRRSDQQMARLRYVFEHTRPTDPVLDGWLGAAVFRPHPLYYFFMHSELLTMLSDSDRDRYLQPLESGEVKPPLIVLDVELEGLGPRFLEFLHRDYVNTEGPFYVRAPGR